VVAVRIVEQFELAGAAIAAEARRGSPQLRIAHGIAVLMIDEEAVRAMIRDAVRSKRGRSKRGPVHVRFVGNALLRLAAVDEREDDIYRGHAWLTRPTS
jgi:hypothetical protein